MDVFDGITLEKHTGQGPMSVAELRRKYGPGLGVWVDPRKFRIARGWERSQVQVITIRFLNEAGQPVEGVEGAFRWPHGSVTVRSKHDGTVDWGFGPDSWYAPSLGEVGPYTFQADGLRIDGLGCPGKLGGLNHDSMSFDVIVNPVGAVPSPEPAPPSIEAVRNVLTLAEQSHAKLGEALATIRRLVS